MNEYLILVGIGVFLMIMFSAMQSANKSSKQVLLNSYFDNLSDFAISNKITGQNGDTALAIDNKKYKVCLLVGKHPNVKSKIFNYNDILECEILEDGESITKTARGSQLGGMLIGGLALGGIGAIIGGLSGSKTNIDKVKSIDLKIVVNDVNEPMFILNFLNVKNTLDPNDGYKNNHPTYTNAIKSARYWHSLLKVLIKKADEEDEKKENIQSTQNLSIADELKKLKLLLDDEILTKEEFEEQKAKLLNKE